MVEFRKDVAAYANGLRAQDEAAQKAIAEGLGLTKMPEVVVESGELDAIKEHIARQDELLEKLCIELETMRVTDGPFVARRIANAVAKAHGLTFRELISQRRHSPLARARQHAMWELRHNTSLSLPHIGKILGNRDHSTVMHGIRRHQARIDSGEFRYTSGGSFTGNGAGSGR